MYFCLFVFSIFFLKKIGNKTQNLCNAYAKQKLRKEITKTKNMQCK